jgi:hypothetical protein
MPVYYFFDSSALVKRYHTEEGTEEVERIFADTDTIVCIEGMNIQ